MVFHRRSDPTPPEPAQALVRRPDRPMAAPAQLTPVSGGMAGPDESVIGSDLTIEGQAITIRSRGTLRVNGDIQADLHCRQIDVGRTAIITGAIAAETVHVHGRVNGAILGQKVTLHSTAEVEGDIHTLSLSIEHGASFDGRSRRVKDAAEIAPQIEKGSGPAGIVTPSSSSTQPQAVPPPFPMYGSSDTQ
ncbi:MAG: polymer-forming cytoskeletal protein [Hyphomicrobium sp.]|nr:polymer-forming cytoskeletal protein [Hyphomicrobium sp.]